MRPREVKTSTITIDGHTFKIDRIDDAYYPYHRENIQVEPDGNFSARWFLDGEKGEQAWTDEEITLVSQTLVNYPSPKPFPWHGVANWFLWKKGPMMAGETVTYAIDFASAGQTDYVGRALRHKDLKELLRIWSVIQDNSKGQ